MSNFDKYLPHLNAADGIKRVMNNQKLYITMLGKFKLREMTEKIAEALASGDTEKTCFAAHALKGTAANLGFPTLHALCTNMEQQAKEGADVKHKLPELLELVDKVEAIIKEFTASEGEV